MSTRNDCHSISDFMLTISFYVRHSMQFWERPERTYGLAAYIALPINSPLFVDFVLLFLFHYETTTKVTVQVHFSQEREWQLNIKSMKMSVRVVQSFNIIVWPTPFLKWPNLKCHVGHMTHFDQFLYWTLLGVFLLSHLCHWLKYHLSQILLLFWIVQVKYPPRYQ